MILVLIMVSKSQVTSIRWSSDFAEKMKKKNNLINQELLICEVPPLSILQ